MPLAYLLEENQRGLLWQYLRRHNARGIDQVDVVRVGDVDDLPLGSEDPDILLWAEREGRILVSRDRETLAKYLAAHLAAGRHSPGIFFVRDVSLADLADFLVCAAHASGPEEWEGQVTYVP